MSDANPYLPPDATTEIVETDLKSPVVFGGMLGVQDLPAMLGHVEMKAVAWSVLFSAGYLCFAVLIVRVLTGESWYLVTYLAMGMAVLPLVSLARLAWPSQNSGSDLKDYVKGQTHERGFVDENGGVWQIGTVKSRFCWDDVRSVESRPQSINLTFWGGGRVFLPSHFFEDEASFYRVLLFLHKRFGDESDIAPKLSDLKRETFAASQCMTALEIAQSRQWSEANWPFPIDKDSLLAVDYRPRKSGLSLRERFSVQRRYLLHFLITLFPLHIAVIVWLASNWFFYGDWSFVWDSNEVIQGWNSALLGLLGYVVFIGMFGCIQAKNYFIEKEDYLTTMKLFFDESGCLTVRKRLCTWTFFDDQLVPVEDERQIGWGRTDGGVAFYFERRWIDPEAALKVETLLQSALADSSS